MNNIDKQYIELLKDILENGTTKTDRTGTGTISVFGRQIRHKMSEGFPILTSKKVAFKTMVTELLWFLRAETNIKYLLDNGCHIWDGDAWANYSKMVIANNLHLIPASDLPKTKEEFINKIKTDDEFAKVWGDLGKIYGFQWRNWSGKIDQISDLIKQLKENPDSRRLLVTAWNPSDTPHQILPPCHYGFQVYTRELSLEERKIEYFKRGYTPNIDPLDIAPTRSISLMFNCRSQDFPLGTPFNISSYALLLEIIAKMVNMVPDELIGNLGDCHIYLNQIEGVKEQVGRDLTEEERYNIWFTNNYETGMERYFDPNNLPNYDDPYYKPTPKRTREPFPLPKLRHVKSDEFYRQLSEDFSIITQIENTDFIIEGYKSHPPVRLPLSN
jgi:thymidylate synthase